MTLRKLFASGFQIERVPRKPVVSPRRAKGAQPAWGKGRLRGCLGTVEWAGVDRCQRGIE